MITVSLDRFHCTDCGQNLLVGATTDASGKLVLTASYVASAIDHAVNCQRGIERRRGRVDVHDSVCKHNWRPMETAPKDGSQIIVNIGKHYGLNVHVAYWQKDGQKWMTTSVQQLQIHPVAWMPVPEPPEPFE